MKHHQTYKSSALGAIHEAISDAYGSGVVDKRTMKHFDETCLIPARTFTPNAIKALREREEVSQAVFALYLNVSKESISQWERGIKSPAGPSLKLLSLVERKGLDAIA